MDYVRANEKLILISHSQGGYNVSQYAVKYKNEVDGLILLDPAYLCTHNDKNTQDLKNAINNVAKT
ncbi:alpha/beta fold hydrolase [Clostridium estertheticum]|uniref:alpha/beta fold hydrolase n=1 Tax=Clostridium estertheticum TaxID=238834 RepID=UPI00124D4EBD|nr:alpha/beta fold hydrolase [Clostridium estertheticum]MBZ9618516.1 alpha/beta hydrolase [Clostridium estertheticum subsp. laramiense]WAG76482.1 alpha/beta hydrolase [Clostridium estertheticum]